MKYSLREVFGLEGTSSTSTRDLMESYEISPAQIESIKTARPSAAKVILEAIETGVIPQFEEDGEVEPVINRTQRDDLALLRWREMAGLDGK